ncbi:MAG: hypothetical protein JST77_14565, partial [Acidobacteria bacterium]|nr:hypothetical protein [Acidobacteriota bacterium]
MKILLSSLLLFLGASALGQTQQPPGPEEFLRTRMQLSASQIRDIQSGKAVAKILSSSERSDIFVFGAVYIHAQPSAYLEFMSDIHRLKKLPAYLGAGKFSEPPQLSDLEGFSLDDEDIKDLRKCKPGKCDLQLPESSMETVRNSIDWNSPDAAEVINHRAKQGVLQVLEAYAKQGDSALGTYRDKPDPLPVGQRFATLLSKVEFFPEYLPELNRYLLDYPHSKPEGTRDFFYWEKVNFGLKPTIRLNHAVLYHAHSAEREIYALAIKQLYASHYFQTAVDLSFCVPNDDASGDPGFYLITIKASRQAGLTGLKGGIIRKVAVGKTRSSLEQALNSIAKTLEHPATEKQ